MNKFLRKLWGRLVNLGIHDDLENRDKIKIRLVNKIGVIGAIISIVLLIVIRGYFGIGHHWRNIGTLLLILAGHYFHHKRKYNLTRHFLCLAFPTHIAFLFIAGNRSLAQINALLLILLLILILYEDKPKLRLYSFVYVLLIGVGAYIITMINPIQLNLEEIYLSHISVFISTLFILCCVVYFYQQDIFEFDDSNNILLDELISKNEELERFAYVTSHDLKEPVRNIGSLAEVLYSRLGNTADIKRNREIVDLIEVSSSRMSSLIDSILDFSKINSQEFYSEEVAIADIVKEFISSHEQLIKARNVKIEFTTLPVVNGNRVFLSLLFQNLFKNSIVYNNSKQPKINVTATNSSSAINISVVDNGIGIEEDFYGYIFEPFKRLNNDTLFHGSGLGLSICKKIVEYHGGTISVMSKLNEGSSFVLNFPRS